MRSSQGNEIMKHAQFHEFKDFDYFKQIFKGSNDLQLKQILPNYILKQTTRLLNHNKYIYLTEKPIDGLGAGTKIPSTKQTLSKRTSLICVTKHLDEVLTKMINLRIPVIDNLKTQNRFLILTISEIRSFTFNRIIRRVNEPLDGIFLIVSGEIKIIQQKKIHKIIGVGNFLGLQQIAQNKQQWSETIASNCNQTKLWFLSKQNLQFIIQNEEKTLKQKLVEYYSENIMNFDNLDHEGKHISQNSGNNICLKLYSKNTKQRDQKFRLFAKNPDHKIKVMKLTEFLRRCQDFKSQANVYNDSGFNQYLKKKKIIVKLGETVSITKQNLNGIRDEKIIKALKINQSSKFSKKNYQSYKQALLASCRTLMTANSRNHQNRKENSNLKDNRSSRIRRTILGAMNKTSTDRSYSKNDFNPFTITHLSNFGREKNNDLYKQFDT